MDNCRSLPCFLVLICLAPTVSLGADPAKVQRHLGRAEAALDANRSTRAEKHARKALQAARNLGVGQSGRTDGMLGASNIFEALGNREAAFLALREATYDLRIDNTVGHAVTIGSFERRFLQDKVKTCSQVVDPCCWNPRLCE